MTYTDSYFMVNKHQQLLKLVDFYKKQIEILGEMLDEVSKTYEHINHNKERLYFHDRFSEMKMEIMALKNEINLNNNLLTEDLVLNKGKRTDTLVAENKKIEKEVISFEKEMNELNKDFKLFIIHNV